MHPAPFHYPRPQTSSPSSESRRTGSVGRGAPDHSPLGNCGKGARARCCRRNVHACTGLAWFSQFFTPFLQPGRLVRLAGLALARRVDRGLHPHRGTAGRSAAAEGDGRAGAVARRHRMGRVHRPARGGRTPSRFGPASRASSPPSGSRKARSSGAATCSSRSTPRPFQAEVDRLRAELARARATVQRAGSELSRAAAPGRRERDVARGAGASRRLRAGIGRAGRARSKRRCAPPSSNLEFTRVISPIDGRVGRAIVTQGNLVSSGPGEATLLTTVVSLDPIYASFEADEQTLLRYMALAREGKRASARQSGLPIRLALASDDDFPREGKMNFLDNQIDPATGTIRGRAIFRNQDRSLTPGLFVRLRLPGSGAYQRRADSGPRRRHRSRQALRARRQRRSHRPVSRRSRSGRSSTACASSAAGSQPQDLVIVNGLQRVRPGAQVDDGEGGDGSRRDPASRRRAHRRCRRRGRRPRRRAGSEAVMKFSRFFIDRPIFAAVLSFLIVVAGALALFRLPISEYPSVVPPTVVVRAAYPGANPKVHRRDRRGAARAADQRRRGHALHVLAVDRRRPDDADHHLRARHRSRQRAGAGAEPRRAGAAAAADRSAAHRRHHREGVARPDDGRAPASRPTRATTCSISRTSPTCR